ncbi:MAG: M28 family peptidase [Cyclobacteriaceae bacterium]|nr:MAG: M28 family peptidase [Cyclobacteriaceae bacterium]
MKRILPVLIFVLLSMPALVAQQAFENYYTDIRKEFSAENTHSTTAFVEQRWRLAGNKGFDESIYYVEKILKDAGFKKEVNGEADGPLTYRIETRKMKRPTWEPVDASLGFEGEAMPFLKFSTNRNMIATYSASTPAEGITAEVVDVGKGKKEDFADKDLKGKIVLAETGAYQLYRQAMEKGAVGVLAYSLPKYTQPEKNVNSIQFQSIAYADSVNQKWAIMLSYQAKEKLKAALAKGSVRVTVKVETKIYKADELTLVANARGTVKPEERFVYSAHVQEPGANDNATGVATLAEMARTTAMLIQQKKFSPQRTITFLWGDEIVSTDRYIKDDKTRAAGIKWGLSLDMVGEDVSKTGGSFLIEKMPDPSAIWTRGKEKHSEWGGSVLKESQMVPHYFNDFLLNRCLQQAKVMGWVVNTNPFEGGSDHTPFLEAKIPGLLMWHFTDVFYHTDGDRLDMTSAEEMKNVGVSALATAYVLASADEAVTLSLIGEIRKNAIDRLEVEFALSKEAVAKSGKVADEQHILEVWTSYYTGALDKMTEIPVKGTNKKIDTKIAAAKADLQKKLDELKGWLEK